MPLMTPGQPLVLINNFPAMTVGDQSQCVSPAGPLPNPIISGAFMVLIGNKPAARQDDFGAHPGSKIFNGSPTVEIGGPATAGNVPLGMDDCQKLAQGRTSGKLSQSYGNCGIESARSIINRANNSKVSEDEMLNKALANGWALETKDAQGITMKGGTYPNGRHEILEHYGVGAVTSPATMQNIVQFVGEGRGVIASIWAARTWSQATVAAAGATPGDAALPHAVRVTGVTLDSNGDPDTVYVIDTSGVDGGCAYAIPAAVFEWALMPATDLNVTENSIW